MSLWKTDKIQKMLWKMLKHKSNTTKIDYSYTIELYHHNDDDSYDA